jgi:hypothetical protein
MGLIFLNRKFNYFFCLPQISQLFIYDNVVVFYETFVVSCSIIFVTFVILCSGKNAKYVKN